MKFKVNFANGRQTTISCDSNEEAKKELLSVQKRFNSKVISVNDQPIEKLALGGVLLATILGGILGNQVAKSGVSKTAKTIKSTTKKTISKTKKEIAEFRSASSKSKKYATGGGLSILKKGDKFEMFDEEYEFITFDVDTDSGKKEEVVILVKDGEMASYPKKMIEHWMSQKFATGGGVDEREQSIQNLLKGEKYPLNTKELKFLSDKSGYSMGDIEYVFQKMNKDIQHNPEFAKGGNIASINRKVNEVNRLIALGNENNISVIDSSGTWESPMKYKPIKYSNGTLYIEYQELDLYKNNRTGVKDWVTIKEKVLKRNMEYDSPLNDIAKWYRKALKQESIQFATGGVSDEYEDNDSDDISLWSDAELALYLGISEKSVKANRTEAVEQAEGLRMMSNDSYYAKGGGVDEREQSIQNEYSFQGNAFVNGQYRAFYKKDGKYYIKYYNPTEYFFIANEESIKNYRIKPMYEDGGMSSMALAGASPQLAIGNEISKRLPATTAAIDRKFAERVNPTRPSMWEDRGLQKMATGGTIGQEITFKHWTGDIRNGVIKEDLGKGNFEVSSGFGNVLVNAEDFISPAQKMAKGAKVESKIFKHSKYNITYKVQPSLQKKGRWEVVESSPEWKENQVYYFVSEQDAINNAKMSAGIKKEADLESRFMRNEYAKGGSTNERNFVNKSEDYEVRYARKNNPSRVGYKGNKKFDDGGGVWKPPYYYNFWRVEMLPYFIKELKKILSKTKDEYLKGIYLNDIDFTIGKSGNYIFTLKSQYNYDLTMEIVIDTRLQVKDSFVLHEIKEWQYDFDEIEQVGGFEGDKPVFKAIEKLCLQTAEKFAPQIVQLKSKKFSGGGSTNERNFVNKSEDYEVRYARKNNPSRVGYRANKKFELGGGIDLFEDYDKAPPAVAKLMEKYEEAFEDGDYEKLAEAHKAFEKIGYTFDYYLDGVAYDLRPIGTKGKVEE